MAGFTDYKNAIAMRDLVQRLAKEEIQRQRPSYQYATVQSIDTANRRASVLYPGEVAPVNVSYGAVIQPTQVGQIVRVDGLLGDRFISDVITPYVEPVELDDWTDLTPNAAANWTHFGGSWPNISYYVDLDGWCHLRGLAKTTSGTGILTTMTTLPVGARPRINHNFLVMANDTPSYVSITSDGVVTHAGPGTAAGYVCLDGVSFPVVGDDYDEMMELLRPAAAKLNQASTQPVSTPNGYWMGFCQPRSDGLVRGFGGIVNIAASNPIAYLPDFVSGRYTELHPIFAYSGGAIDADARLDIEMPMGRIAMSDVTFGASLQIDITGRQFWPNAEAGWINLPMLNSWTGWGGTFTPPQYRKDAYGVVHLRGLITGGTGTFGTPVAELPVGYRPVVQHLWTVKNGTGSTRIDSLADGKLYLNESGGATSTYTSLEGIRFRTDA